MGTAVHEATSDSNGRRVGLPECGFSHQPGARLFLAFTSDLCDIVRSGQEKI